MGRLQKEINWDGKVFSLYKTLEAEEYYMKRNE